MRRDRDDLAFFPSIYNEDWFFFSEETASRRIGEVRVSGRGAGQHGFAARHVSGGCWSRSSDLA